MTTYMGDAEAAKDPVTNYLNAPAGEDAMVRFMFDHAKQRVAELETELAILREEVRVCRTQHQS